MARTSVSVVIPTHNRFPLLQRAIRSVLDQEFDGYEIIIVDDGSTDDTPLIPSMILDPRVRYIRRDSSGSAGAARNTGCRASRGELICFLDDDDEYLPGFLEAVHRAFLESSAEVGFGWCGTRTVRTGVEGAESLVSESSWTPRYPDRATAYVEMLKYRRIGTNAGFSVRREAFEAVGGFDERLRKAEDTDLLVRLAREFDFVVVPQVLVKVHVHDGPRLTSYDDRMADAYEWILEKHYETIASSAELLVAFHYKTGWLQYHAGNRTRAREHMRIVRKNAPRHWRSIVVTALFECIGSRAAGIHRRISGQT